MSPSAISEKRNLRDKKQFDKKLKRNYSINIVVAIKIWMRGRNTVCHYVNER